MSNGPHTLDIVLLLAVIATVMLMLALLVRGMPMRHGRWFFAAMFAMLSVVMFHMHWAAGVAIVILGAGAVAVLDGIMRRVQKEKENA